MGPATLRRPRRLPLMLPAAVPALPAPPALPAAARSPLWGAIGLTLLAAHFRLGGLSHSPESYFYDAAVRSMSLSWHNFFFGAFDPSGALAVDKPPVDLWLQVASVKLFGFSPRSLVLPAAIAGTIAVPLLYDAVRRLFGTVAGLCAGAALAVMPVSVVASRSDALDSLMMMLALLAFWLVVLAVQRGRARYLYLAAMVMGLDFNVKLFEALVPLPAIALLYLLASREGVRRRIEHLAAAGALFVAVSISWAAAVSLSPAHSRPFPIGSSDGSVWNVIFVYNGLNRLSPPPSTAAVHSHSSKLGLLTGTPGAHLAPELVASAMLGLLALIACARLRGAARTRRAAVIALTVWLLTGLVLFGHMTNLRARYLEAFTPAVAAVLGIGVALLAAAAARGKIAAAAALAVGLVASPLVLQRLTTPPAAGPSPLAIAAGVAAAAIAVAAVAVPRLAPGARRLARYGAIPVAALALVSLLAQPASSSARAVRRHQSDAGIGSPLPAAKEVPLERWLHAHRGSSKYEVAAAAPAKVAKLIAHDGQPVLVLTSYKGRAAVTVPVLRADVLAGRLRWVLMDHRCTPSTPAGCAAPVMWVEQHGRDVTRVAGIPGHGVLFEVSPATLRAPASASGRTTTRPRRPRSAQSARHRRGSHPARRARRRRS